MQPPELISTGSTTLDAIISVVAGMGIIEVVKRGVLAWQNRRDRVADSATNDIITLREDLWKQVKEAREEQRAQRLADLAATESLRAEIRSLNAARNEDARVIGELRGQVIVLQAEIASLQSRLNEARKEIDAAKANPKETTA